jgi:hypothetical protein
MRYNIPPPPSLPQEDSIARSLLLHADRALLERIREHEARYNDFWNSVVPPSTIAEKLGENGLRFLFDASESVRHITVLVCGPAYLTMTEEERTQKLHEYLPPEKYVPRLPLTPDPATGRVSVGAVDGLDEWGRPIPEVIEPEVVEVEVVDEPEE